MHAAARSRRAWGWHRLTDEWAARVVAAARIRPGQLVVDIGAGEGALTRPLVAAGARVVAVEPHPRRAAVLRQRFTGADLTIVECEAASLTLPRRPFRVVASPPYAISSPLLRMLLAPGSALVAADLVLQRAVSQRYADRGVPAARVSIGASSCGWGRPSSGRHSGHRRGSIRRCWWSGAGPGGARDPDRRCGGWA